MSLVKTACMVERNGYDYARYLCEVFVDDKEFQQVAHEWAAEEVQHGEALRKWAELADPAFDFHASFSCFSTGYKLPANVQASVRGSRTGELIARCVVETGTSSYYTAIKESTDEPVLQTICGHIAADELRHYKLFYTYLKRYIEREKIGSWQRMKIAFGRIMESDDDELAYAFFAAHDPQKRTTYNHAQCRDRYLAYAYALYRPWHVQRMVSMVLKAIGFAPHGIIGRMFNGIAWNAMQWRMKRLNIAGAN